MATQYLTFTLNNTLYAAEVTSVQEVLEYQKPQELPCADVVIAGIIRSRGKSIAVVNMRNKFGLPEKAPDNASKIVVFELHTAETNTVTYLGAITDTVQEVIEISSEEIEPPPEAVKDIKNSQIIKGVSEKENKFLIILDIEKLFSPDELTSIFSLADIQVTGVKQ